MTFMTAAAITQPQTQRKTMRTSAFLALGLAVALTTKASAGTGPIASAPESIAQGGFFIGAKGGPLWLQDESFTQGSISADIHFKTGWGVTVPIGYDFGNGVSIAFTAGYYEAGVDSISLHSGGRGGSFGASGDVQFVPLMANAAYSLKLIGDLHWYLGAGLGTVYEKDSVNSVGPVHVGYTDSSWRFGFQAFSGLRYDVCRSSSLFLGYRYLLIDQSGGNHNGHSLEAGLNWRF
jgi:opacity protein-like surface antigen